MKLPSKLSAKLSMLIIAGFIFFTNGCAFSALPNFVPLAKEAGQAVVNISTERTVQTGGLGSMFPEEMFRGMPREFEELFRHFGQGGNSGGRERKQSSLGTGFIISNDGYIVTNNHVIEKADKIFVNFHGKEAKSSSLVATVVGTDPETDIALLKIEYDGKLPTLKFGNSEKSEVGEWVLAIGNPFGLGHTVTAGIISAKGRDIHAGPFDSFIQTDASINPGNSGGPLINMKGEVIGINTAIIASGQGIGFAIPSEQASRIIEALKSGKKVSRGWLGVSIQDVSENSAKALGLKNEEGAIISSVMPNEPADKAGIKAGDVIIKVDNTKVTNSSELLKAIANIDPGKSANLTLIRNGKERKVRVILGERKTEGETVQGTGKAQDILGMNVRALTKEEKDELKIKSGVVITEISSNSIATENGLRRGDVLVSANLTEVNTPDQLLNIINKEGKQRGAIFLQVIRNKQEFSLALPVK